MRDAARAIAGFVISITLLGGCVARNYCVRRAALVPAPAPALRPARQTLGYVEADVSAETAAWAKPPRRLLGRNVGLYIPREQFSGQLLFSPHRVVSFGFSFESGLPEGAVPVAPGQIQPPAHAIGGSGLHFALHFKASERITIGWSSDIWAYVIASRIAYREASSCAGLPDPRTWSQMHKDTLTFIGRTQLGAGFDFGWSHLTVGAGVRNQPHNVDESLEVEYTPADIDPRISHTVYPFIYLNWEFRLARWLYLGATVYQPLNFDPVIFAPIFGINLRMTHVARERSEWQGPKPRPVPAGRLPWD